jgi:hypothetical protein
VRYELDSHTPFRRNPVFSRETVKYGNESPRDLEGSKDDCAGGNQEQFTRFYIVTTMF